MRSFWRMTEERTRPRWIWKIKVALCNTNTVMSHQEQVDHSLCSPVGFKDLMNEVFSFIGKEPFSHTLPWFILEHTYDSKLQLTPPHRWRSPAQTRASGSTRLSVTTTTCCRSHGSTSESTSTCVSVCLGMSDLTRPSRWQELGHRLLRPHQERRGGGADIPADHRAHGEGHGRVRHRLLRREGRCEEDRRADRTRWGRVDPALPLANEIGHLEITVWFCSFWRCLCRIPETQVSWSIVFSFTSCQ